MEHLPQTKGKGVLMFARRRQRIDEIAAEHEDLRSKGIPVEAFVEPEIDASLKPQVDIPPVQQYEQGKHQLKYQDHQTQQQIFLQPDTGINGLDSCPDSSGSKALVPNRTAKPFLSGLNQSQAQFSPVTNASSPTIKKSESFFKVPVPVKTSPQVWSPTGDIIASRDERIAVPAIKTVILPEMKRRGKNKANSKEPPEEDYFSLGAEACNFMRAPTIRQKQPPPVLPKPTINPHCPSWSPEVQDNRSPLTPSSPLPAQENWAAPHPLQSQPATKPWGHSTARSTPQQQASDYLPSKQSTSYKSTWSSEQKQALTTASPSQPRFPQAKPQSISSVVSCPPQSASSYVRKSKAPPISSISEIGSSDGPVLKGKGAELFARRQSRMEKFIIDAETVKANIARSPSPTLSMPSTWKYSTNVRAPPPLSYNPIVSPFYPPAAQKQSLPATSSSIKHRGNKEKPKTAPKTLTVMDVMKHQPYQLDSSLFTYSSNTEAKGSSLKTSPVPPAELKQTQGFLHASSPAPSTGSGKSFQQGGKPSGPVSVPYPFNRQSTSAEACSAAQATAPSPAPAPTPAPRTMHPGPLLRRSSIRPTADTSPRLLYNRSTAAAAPCLCPGDTPPCPLCLRCPVHLSIPAVDSWTGGSPGLKLLRAPCAESVKSLAQKISRIRLATVSTLLCTGGR
ncbi:synaptopodin-2 isoform X2 [Tachysurus fulvidraco]|uniref:synaptopodin-2 isoform X2 n=1 Tax=Tachysurus fulvidraco TaxID=1234273 RepID=UPI001FF04EDA|nr:synaptopodin-2 isoform X2 [Tachysurus fulvidraco]